MVVAPWLMLLEMLLYSVKVSHSYWFNKMLIDQFQAGSIGSATRLREFWESQPSASAEEAR